MKKTFVFIALVLTVLFTTPLISYATTFSVGNTGGSLGLGTSDLKTTTVNILNWALGLMALIAVGMIIFSGIIAATSSDEDRAATAKRVISGAVIGLIIVLLAWAIVIFVANTTANVTV